MISETDILSGLIARGLPPHAAAGVVMNLRDESGLNPGINEAVPLVPGSRGGYGLAQWTGPRRNALEGYAAERGAPVSDYNLQLDFLMQELQGPERRAMDSLLATTTPEEAAVAFLRDFERPAQVHMERRAAEYAGGAETPDLNALAAQQPAWMPQQAPRAAQPQQNALAAWQDRMRAIPQTPLLDPAIYMSRGRFA